MRGHLPHRETQRLADTEDDGDVGLHAPSVAPHRRRVYVNEFGQSALGNASLVGSRVDDIEPEYCVGCTLGNARYCGHARNVPRFIAVALAQDTHTFG